MQSYAIRPSALILDPPTGREYILTIRDLPAEEKPREKLILQGPEALSIRELMAVVFTTGTVKEDVLEMADRVVREYGERTILAERDPEKLSRESKLPIVKACQVVAVGELGRRFYDRNQSGFTTIRNAKEAYEYLHDMRNLSKEHLRGLYLNSRNRVIRDEVISIGTVNSNIVHPREVFRPGIEYNAAAVILAHNHPSGDAAPSDEDTKITEQLIRAGKILGISILDHIIVAKDAFASVKADY
ncbi:DNA repair protein RadC [Patescibacteria group bacterium]|nr:DNA repair protein RadC [Patescibacteria group bacterium]MDE1946781.1 DNA repair protein RadC [Patescibacteria group bacterium]MDE2011087.1 DNA repair protein RadC [Patescibacteria group bacterium]MDE2233144.1 DNA repair protein RadC [Patescibacteria group bacterium]